MPDPADALAAAARPASRTPAPGARVLVLGGGGALGARVVERLLAGGAWAAVGVWTVQPLRATPRGLVGVGGGDAGPDGDIDADVNAAWHRFAPQVAVVVFDRARHANGRDDAFGRPQPAQLPALAARLRQAGAAALVVVVPHAPGLLPQSLKLGLASLDEAAVAGLGFRHLVFMRAAQAGAPAGARHGASAPPAPARLARWLLGQLHWMVPQGDQPVRSDTVARVAARLALALPQAAPGTRVLPPEVLWAAAQTPASAAVVDDWLAGRPLAPPGVLRRW